MFRRILLAALLPVAFAAPTQKEDDAIAPPPAFTFLEGFDSVGDYKHIDSEVTFSRAGFVSPPNCDRVCGNDPECTGYIEGFTKEWLYWWIFPTNEYVYKKTCWTKTTFKGREENSYSKVTDSSYIT